MTHDITVVIPSIPPRAKMLRRALHSVTLQSLQPAAVIVELDHDHTGAAATRQRGLSKVDTEFVAFMDDDDILLPAHLETLRAGVDEHQADYTFSYFTIQDGVGRLRPDIDPLGHFGRRFDPASPTQTTITLLARTKLAQAVGFREPPVGATIGGECYGEDFQFTVEMVAAGAHVVHIPERTWYWVHHGLGAPGNPGNTSGRPDRW